MHHPRYQAKYHNQITTYVDSEGLIGMEPFSVVALLPSSLHLSLPSLPFRTENKDGPPSTSKAMGSNWNRSSIPSPGSSVPEDQDDQRWRLLDPTPDPASTGLSAARIAPRSTEVAGRSSSSMRAPPVCPEKPRSVFSFAMFVRNPDHCKISMIENAYGPQILKRVASPCHAVRPRLSGGHHATEQLEIQSQLPIVLPRKYSGCKLSSFRESEFLQQPNIWGDGLYVVYKCA